MATKIRYCPPVKCRVGETVKLTVEGFQSNPDRGCQAFYSAIGTMPGAQYSFGLVGAISDTVDFTPATPGKYVIRALCCCIPPNGN